MSSGNITAPPYIIESKYISYNNGILVYTNKNNKRAEFNLNELWLGPSNAEPWTKRITSDIRYQNTALALCDLTIRSARDGSPDSSVIRSKLRMYRNTIDWLQMHSVYSLKDASIDDWNTLYEHYANVGWSGCLNLEERTMLAISSTDLADLSSAFHYIRGEISCINQEYWRKKIGWGWQLSISRKVYDALNDLTPDIPKAKCWTMGSAELDSPPTTNMLVRYASWITSLYHLPYTVDKIATIPSCANARAARKHTKRENTRNKNLSVDVAVELLGAAYDVMENILPLVLELLNDGKKLTAIHSAKKFPSKLQTLKSKLAVESVLQVRITAWCSSRHRRTTENEYTVVEIISIVQGAAAILIAALTARRQREICDPEIGIRREDFYPINEIYAKCNFYIEKTLQDRDLLNITAFTGQVIKNLISLSDATNWDNIINTEEGSIFKYYSLGAAFRPRKMLHFRFVNESNVHTNSLEAFLTYAFRKSTHKPDLNPHMLRRLYGIIYLYRFDEPRLRALSKHYRHTLIASTRTYVTDPPSRDKSESIQAKMGLGNGILKHRRLTDDNDLTNIINDVSEQKFRETVTAILNGQPCLGGFAKIVRKLYQKLTLIGEFDNDANVDSVISLLAKNKHFPKPFSHSQCNAPCSKINPTAKCFNDGHLCRSEASAIICNGCIYQAQFDIHLQNIAIDIASMNEKLSLGNLPPIEADRLNFSIEKTTIILRKAQAAINAQNSGKRNA